MNAANAPQLTHALERRARYVIASAVAKNARVLDLGATDARGALILDAEGASGVTLAVDHRAHIAAEVEEAGVPRLEVRELRGLPLAFSDEAFDLVVCHDLPARLRDDPAWLAELRRVLSPSGYLITALRNPLGPLLAGLAGRELEAETTYDQLSALLAQHFAALTVFGQSPWVGAMFYDFEVDELEPEVDRSLLPDEAEEPGWYVIVGGPDAIHSDKLTLIQLPFMEVSGDIALNNRLLDEQAAELAAAEQALAESEHHHARLRHEVDDQSLELQRMGNALDSARLDAEAASLAASEQRAAAERVATARALLEGQVRALEQQLDTLRAAVDIAENERDLLRGQHEVASAELASARATIETTQTALEAHAAAAAQAQRDVIEVRRELDTQRAAVDNAHSERELMRVQHEVASAELASARATIEATQTALEAHAAAAAQAQRDAVEVRRERDDFATAMNVERDDRARALEELASWQRQHEEALLRIEALEREAAALAQAREDEVRKALEQQARADEVFVQVEQALESARSAAEQTQHDQERLRVALERAHAESAVLGSELDAQRAAREAFERQAGELLREVAQRSSLVASCEARIAQLDRERGEVDERCSALQRELERAHSLGAEHSEAARQERQRTKDLLEQLVALQAENAELRRAPLSPQADPPEAPPNAASPPEGAETPADDAPSAAPSPTPSDTAGLAALLGDALDDL